jgi:hypothetical protein
MCQNYKPEFRVMLVPTPFTVLGFISILPTLQIGIHDYAREGFQNYFKKKN